MDWLMRHIGWTMTVAVVLFLTLIIVAAGLERDVEDKAEDVVGYGGAHSDEETGTRTLFHTGVWIGGLKQGETYGAFNARRNSAVGPSFKGFGCIGSCKAHEEGFRWAAANRVQHLRECRGPNWPFVEGCAAFVQPGRP